MANQKAKTKFYPLTSEELIYLCQLLTDAEVKTLLYLKSIHPFTDSYQELDTSTLAEHLNISRRSIQRFLKKFKELNLIEWEITQFKYKPIQLVTTVGSPKRQPDRQDDSRIAKTTAGSPKRQTDRYQSMKPLPDKDSILPQTIQTIPDSSDRTGEEENFSSNSDVPISKNESHQALTGLNSIFENRSLVYSSSEKEDTNFPLCSTAEFEISTLSQVKSQGNPQKRLTPELMAKLEELKIPLDGAVRKAIAQSHPSQIWSALQHIEDTWDEIKSPKGVFLYQVPLQSKDERKAKKDPFTPEFREWYRTVIADGLVVNRSIESLGLYQFVEPIVQLPDGSQWPWTQVRDGKVIQPTAQERQQGFNQELLEQLKQKASCSSIGYKYLSSQEKARLELERYRKSQELGGNHVST